MLHVDIMRQILVWTPQAATFQATLEVLNALDFPVCFLPSNTKEMKVELIERQRAWCFGWTIFRDLF